MDVTSNFGKKERLNCEILCRFSKNKCSIKDSYPLPRNDDILDQLSGNIWFTTLDLKSGYWQNKNSPAR